MKKKQIFKNVMMVEIILFSTLFSQIAKAQNTFPSSGNTGIGTATPDSKLHIISTGTAWPGYACMLTALHIENEVNPADMPPFGSPKDIVNISNVPHDPITGAALTPLPLFMINGNGNVGIGLDPSTSSTYLLDVAGDIHTRTNATIDGYVGINTPASTSYRLNVSGDGNVSNDFTIGGYVGINTAPSTSYRLNVSGDGNISNDFAIGRYVNANGYIGINTAASTAYRLNVSGNAKVSDDLTVGGLTSGDLIANHDLLIARYVNAYGYVGINTPATTSYRLDILGNANISSDLNLGTSTAGDLTANHDATITRYLNANGYVGINTPAGTSYRLNVSGNANVSSDMTIGTSTTGDLTANHNAIISKVLTAGTPYVGAGTADLTSAGDVNVEHNELVRGDLTILGTLNYTTIGTSTFTNIHVTNNATIDNNTTVGNNLTVSGSLIAANVINPSLATTVYDGKVQHVLTAGTPYAGGGTADLTSSGDVNVEHNCLVRGDLTILGTLNYTLAGTTTFTDIHVTHDATIDNLTTTKDLDVTNDATIGSTAGGDLTVTNNATIDKDLTVGTTTSGNLTATNNGTIKKVLTVGTATTGDFNSNGDMNIEHNGLIRGYLQIGSSISTPGSSTPDYQLYVQTGILTEKLKVANKTDATNWSDFVFNKDYKLQSLDKVEAFVKENKHLPEIPSAADVARDGIDVAAMDAKLLQKIEELTLYVIDQQKSIKKLEKENKTLQQKIANLKK